MSRKGIHHGGWLRLGRMRLRAGRVDDAVHAFHQAMTGGAASAATWDGLRRIVRTFDQAASALTNLGVLLDNDGRYAQAIASYRAALEHDPGMAVVYYNMGNSLRNMGDTARGVEAFREALRLKPDFPEAYHNLAVIHQELGELPEAICMIRQALELRPRYPAALHTLGELHQAQELYDDAIAAFTAALEANPDSARTWNSLGIVFQGLEQDERALACYRQALARVPAYPHALNNLGSVLLSLGRPAEGIMPLRRLIEADPGYSDGHWNLACCLLACGDFEEGWREYEWRFRKHSPVEERHCAIPRWDGKPCAGKTILFWGEQGLGDTIQFIRYASLPVQWGMRVMVECQTPSLRPLIEGMPGIARVIVRGEEVPAADFQAPMLSLPLLLADKGFSISSRVPYLATTPGCRRRWEDLLRESRGLRVGLVWGGRQTHRNRRRSCRLADFAPLASLTGITWFSLQVGDQAREAAAPPAGMQLVDLTPHIHDFADTAALLEQMDLVLTIDTSVAHLAGALGRPVRVLLPVGADWRWLTERDDSPWYPTMRLLRQGAPGDWSGVMAVLRDELTEITGGSSHVRGAAWMDAGDAHRLEEAWSDALKCYLRALAVDPLDPLARLRAGGCLIFLNRHDEAKTHLQRAAELTPDDPDAHLNLAIAHLATGCERAGWSEYEWRRRNISAPFPPIPELPPLGPGKRLDGTTLMVHTEQGFGDMLQFVRYLPRLAALGARVILSAPPELARLFRSCAGVERVIPHGEPLPAAHFQTLLLSLPLLLGEPFSRNAGSIPYLAPPPHLADIWRRRLSGVRGMKVGLAWQGREMNKNGYRRALAVEQLSPLLGIPGCSFLTLQPNPCVAGQQLPQGILDTSAWLSDFADTAALIASLDLVISVDTSVAHLAGAMGKPCWVALLHSPDWRWFPMETNQCGWYPLLRLFRQEEPGDWDGVVNRVAAELQTMVCRSRE